MLLIILKMFFQFFRNIWGVFQYPHRTYQKLVKAGDISLIGQICLIWFLIFLVLSWTMAVKNGIFRNPYFFAISLSKFFLFSLLSYFLISGWLYLCGKIISKPRTDNLTAGAYDNNANTFVPNFRSNDRTMAVRGKKGNFLTILNLWAYSYIPTMMWFFIVSLLFFVFPPPRSQSAAGYFLSGFFILLSMALLYWKLLLYYLTIRIGFRITWKPILKVSAIFFPLMVIYSYIIFRMGVFKVPFI